MAEPAPPPPAAPAPGLVYEESKPGEYFVQAPDGTVGTVPEADLDQARADGFTVATPQQVQQARDKAIYESVGGKAATAALGAGRGLFLGAPVADMAFEAGYGGASPEAKQTILGLQQANPNTYLAGEVAGSLLVPGGGKGEGLARAMGRAAAEGAVSGVGNAISDSYLNNQPITGEKLAAAALSGGSIGAGAVGGFSLAGRGLSGLFRGGAGLLSRAARRPGAGALQRAGDDIFGAAAPGLGKALDAADAATASLTGAPRGALRDLLGSGRGGRRGYQWATEADEVLAKAGDDVTERLGRIVEGQNTIARRFKGDLKADQIGKLVSRGDDAAIRQLDASKLTLDRLRGDVTDMLGREADFGGRGFLKKTSKRLDAIERKIDGAAAAGDADAGAKAYMWLDGLKRDIGKRATKMTRRAQRGGTTDDLASAQWFDNAYERVRGVLEDGSTWGKAADAQKAINKQWARGIEAGRDFDKLFTARKQGRFGASTRVVDRERVGGFLRGLKNPDKAGGLDALNRQLDEIEDFVRVGGDNLDLTAAERKRIAQLGDEVTGLRRTLGDAREAVTRSNQLAELEKADAAGGLLGLGGLGGLLGGAPGAALGGITGFAARPGDTVRKIAAVHRIIGGVDGSKAKALAKVASGAVKSVSRATRGKGARVVSALQREYDRRSATAERVRREPELARQEAVAALAPVAPGAPLAAEHAADVFMRQQEYLAGLLPPNGRPPNAAEAQQFVTAARVLEKPTTLLTAGADGTVTHAQVRAVEAVYPQLLAEMRSDVMGQLLTLEERGMTVPYGRRISLSVLMGEPLDPMLQPEMRASLQATYAMPPAEDVSPAPAEGQQTDLAGAYALGSGPDPRI